MDKQIKEVFKNGFYCIEPCPEIKELQAELKRKEQECEELKEWKEKVVNLFNKTCRCKYLNEENNHCGFYNRKCIGYLNQCLYKNQQTLTEIKDIVFPKNQLIITDSPIILKIQEKISEVEDD